MKIFVDDQPVADRTYATVEEAVRAVQAECPPGRLVVQLRCDGRDVAGDSVSDTLRKRTSAVSKLELFTSTKRSLLTDTVDQASSSLQATEQDCRRVAELLTQGRTQEALELFGECVRVWQQIHTAVTKSIAMLGLDAETVTIRDVPLGELLLKPKEALLQVRDAVAAQDYVMLADILQYELSEVADQWHSVLSMIRDSAEQLAAGPSS